MDNKEFTSRTEKRKIEEAKEKICFEHEKRMEEKRQELKKVLFDDISQKKSNVDNFKKEKQRENNYTEKKGRKPVKTNILLSLIMVIAFAFTGFMIYDSFNKVDQLYQLINSFLILIIVICFVAAFKKSFTKKKTFATVLTGLLIIIFMGFNVAIDTNLIILPKQNHIENFKNKSLIEAIKWAEANNIKYDQNFEYSDNIKKYSIIDQDINENTLTKNINKVNFTVSNGPNYEKEVVIASMIDWNIDDAIKVIDKELLNNVTINYEENLEIEKDIIIDQNKTGTIKRNDALVFTVSLGLKENLTPIKFTDLKNLSLFKATLYLNRNNIEYELKYEFSEKIEKDNVIKSSIKKGTVVSPGDKITLTISKGKKIVVPELKNMKLSDFTKWIIFNNLKMSYSDNYDDNIKSGYIIEGTYKKDEIIEEETVVGIVVSKGILKMPKFNSLSSFKVWAEKYKIKYEIKDEENSDVKKGEFIKFSLKTGEIIDQEEGIIVYVSKGKLIEIPNYVGKAKSEIQTSCANLNIKCSFITEYNLKTKSGYAIRQNKKAGDKIAESDTIQITIATDKKSSGTSGGSSSNNNSSNSSNPTSCSITKTGTFWWIPGNTYNETISMMKGQNTLVKSWTFNSVNQCSNGNSTSGVICSATIADGASYNNCSSVTVSIIK